VFGSACGWGWAAAAPAAASSIQAVVNTGSSAMPHLTNKKLGNAACRALSILKIKTNEGKNTYG